MLQTESKVVKPTNYPWYKQEMNKRPIKTMSSTNVARLLAIL